MTVKVSGYGYKTELHDGKLQKGYTGEIAAGDISVRLAEISKIFKDAGYREVKESNGMPQYYTARYYGSDAVCYIDSRRLTYDDPSSSYATRVVCSQMSDFKKTAAAQEPFFEVAKNDVPFDDGGALYGLPTITNSVTEGYKTATLLWGVADRAAGASQLMFHQTPDGKWYYTTRIGGTGPQPSCDSFTTDAAKQAYSGATCYEGIKASTVKP